MNRSTPIVSPYRGVGPAGRRLISITDSTIALTIGGLYIAAGGTTWYFAIALVTAICYSMLGRSALPIFVVALSASDGMLPVVGIPLPRFVLLLASFSAALTAYGLLNRRRIELNVPSAVLTVVIGAYYVVVPPSGNASAAAAYALVVLPLTLTLMSLAGSIYTADKQVRGLAFTLGAAVGIGKGLAEAYETVGANYQAYAAARVFESSIGSSNIAAAVAAAIGFLLVGMAGEYSKARWFLWAGSLPFLIAPVVFASRGSLLSGVLVIALALLFAGFKTLPRLVVVATAGVVALTLMFGALRSNLLVLERFQPSTESDLLSGRTDIWRYVWERITERPLIGWGPGGITEDLLAAGMTAYPHQVLLGLVAQVGLIGLIAFFYVIYRTVPRKWSAYSSSIAYLIIVSMVEPVISTPGVAPLFACLLALAKNTERNDR